MIWLTSCLLRLIKMAGEDTLKDGARPAVRYMLQFIVAVASIASAVYLGVRI